MLDWTAADRGHWNRDLAESLSRALAESLAEVYGARRPMPESPAPVAGIPEEGLGAAALPDLWHRIVAGGTKLASPWMFGHMDTAPHPAAALTDALVSALNNNLLFRELSPFASAVEETLIAELAAALGLAPESPGLFCSGGSLANLTALFAAAGGYAQARPRSEVLLAIPQGAHASLKKAAAILGLPPENVIEIDVDAAGRLVPAALDGALQGAGQAIKVAVGVLGGTVTGSVDDLPAIAAVCRRHGAWFHVDAVYGGALAFCRKHRRFLAGLEAAQSIAVGPQKWLYTPRLCALALFPGLADFDARLGVVMPYSARGERHRGTWGLQGSRRADAVTLWAVLQVLGKDALGEIVDDSIDLARAFHAMLEDHPQAEPLHAPDLNLQAFRFGPPDLEGTRSLAAQSRLEEFGRAWVSVSRWQEEFVFRAVLLNPATGREHLARLLDDLA